MTNDAEQAFSEFLIDQFFPYSVFDVLAKLAPIALALEHIPQNPLASGGGVCPCAIITQVRGVDAPLNQRFRQIVDLS
jgi:hypothetical protein